MKIFVVKSPGNGGPCLRIPRSHLCSSKRNHWFVEVFKLITFIESSLYEQWGLLVSSRAGDSDGLLEQLLICLSLEAGIILLINIKYTNLSLEIKVIHLIKFLLKNFISLFD